MQKNISDIYDKIIDFIGRSIQRIEKASSLQGGELIESERVNSINLLDGYKKKVTDELKELRNLSEWDVFTVAVYGETNAGKSTVIETLRIKFGELKKRESQERFFEIAKKINFNFGYFSKLQQSIRDVSLKNKLLCEDFKSLKKQHAAIETSLVAEQDKLSLIIQERLRDLGLWQKFVHLFKKIEEELELEAMRAKFLIVKKSQQLAEFEIKSNIDRGEAELKKLEGELSSINENLDRAVPYQDGVIIGNGRSDFTLESQSYNFKVNDQQFSLIDVPGIEGDEKTVTDAINGAVKKAHAILYITRKPSPPNKGEVGEPGTIEKIQRQLGNQTEVWAVYNKGVTNPIALQSPKLINDGEEISLKDLEIELKNQLGNSFRGCVSLSALPAFYASAVCLIPTGSHFKNQQKFLSGMDKKALFEKSGGAEFIDFFEKTLCANSKRKITESNFHKIREVVKGGLAMLQGMIGKFIAAKNKIEIQLRSAVMELDRLEDSIEHRIKSRCRDKLAEIKSENRRIIYSSIDQDISNDEFKRMLEHRIDDLKDELSLTLKEALHREMHEFESEIKEVVMRFMKNADELLDVGINRYFSTAENDFKTEFKIDNGINKLGLFSSLSGTAGLVWAAMTATNPILLAITAVTLLFSFYKSVRGFFSSSYKKEQQRKSADENLTNLFAKIEEKFEEGLSEARSELTKEIKKIQIQLSVPLQSVNEVLEALMSASKDINQVKEKIA